MSEPEQPEPEVEPGLPFTPITFDANANALYYRLTSKPVASTKAIGSQMRVNVDVDEDGEPVGIEILDPPGFSGMITSTSLPA